MKKNAIVGQSGGPTSVINASLYGVVYEALNREDVIGTIYGMINGIEGFLNENMMDMKPLEVNGELELIKTTPGSYLGSCRYKLPEDLTDAVYPQLFEKFEKYNIGYFFYIGGNDSMDTVSKLSRYAETVNSEIRFIGIPKTIDNDLVLTDHTPGFGSAAKYVASTVREIAIDASVYDNKKSVTIVEIMGRHAGWLAAASVLARKFEGDNPVLIYLPEVPFDVDKFLAKVKDLLNKKSSIVIPDYITINGVKCKVITIKKKALYKGTKLKKLTIGKNIQTIEDNAFNGCKNLKSITIKSTVLKKVGKNAIKGIHKKAVIKVPKKQYKKYKKLFGKKSGFKKPMRLKK